MAKLKTGKALILRDALNKLMAKWGLMLAGEVRLRALNLIGKLNLELTDFDKMHQELFEKFGQNEIRTIPASEENGTVTPERKEETGNKFIPKDKMAEFIAAKEPLLNVETDLDEEKVFGRFLPSEFAAIDPKGDQQELLEQSACLYELTDLIKFD